MLVLSRKIGESIVFQVPATMEPFTIEMKFVDCHTSKQVKLGIVAPLVVRVLRKELVDREQGGNGQKQKNK